MTFNFAIFKHTKFDFDGKRDDENVEMFLYSHWIIITLKTIFYFLIGVVPLVPILVFSRYIVENKFTSLTLFILTAYYMILWSLYFYQMMKYLLNNWIVTDQRILDIVQHSFFYRTVAELDLTRVQDISVCTRGLIQTVLDYGDIQLQSAGTIDKFIFRNISHPEMVKDKITKLIEDAKKKNVTEVHEV